jgi:hypothetical protein
MSSDLNDSGPGSPCTCTPQTPHDSTPTPTETTNGTAPAESQTIETNHSIDPAIDNDINACPINPHESIPIPLIDDPIDDSVSPVTDGIKFPTNIDAPLANSHLDHQYPEHDSVPSIPHSPPSTTNGAQNDATSQTPDPELRDQSMPIAIVGIGSRFPGDATYPDKLWDLISEGRSAQSEFPKDRFNLDAFYHPSAERKGAVSIIQLKLSPRVFGGS